MTKQYKFKSRINYKIGTILLDNDKGIVYEVLKVDRIGITDDCNWGITTKKLTKKLAKELQNECKL